MKNDYLWNGEGDRDPEVARLEQTLRPLRHRQRPLDMSAVRRHTSSVSGASRMTWRGPALLLALAATLVLLVRGTLNDAGAPSSAWTLEMAPASGDVTATREGTALKLNEWIVVDRTARARLSAEGVGVVELEPGSRVRLVSSSGEGHRLALSLGVLHARIWATPGQFSVETPSATAIDLGCAYTLEVDGTGASRLRVTMGWVGLANAGREAFVPAGAVCVTTPDGIAGTPRLEDVPPEFARALDVLDGTARPAHGDALDVVLNGARAQDAFSLWHLLTRLDATSAVKVYARLAVIAPPPPQVTREQILARDRAALDAWWDSFGIGDTSWYRTYRAGTGRR